MCNSEIRLNLDQWTKYININGIQFQRNRKTTITQKQGHELAKQTEAFIYVECLALTGKGVREVFNEAILAVKKSELYSPKASVSSDSDPQDDSQQRDFVGVSPISSVNREGRYYYSSECNTNLHDGNCKTTDTLGIAMYNDELQCIDIDTDTVEDKIEDSYPENSVQMSNTRISVDIAAYKENRSEDQFINMEVDENFSAN